MNMKCVLFLLSAMVAIAAADFTIVVLPDPQNLTESDANAPYLNEQVQWAVDNKVAENIQAVVTVGDMMNGPPTLARLGRAVTAMNMAKSAGLPVMPIVGNHDYDADSVSGRATTLFDGGFGPSYFSGQPYYGASSYPSGSNANYYVMFTVSSQPYIVLALEVFPRPAAIAWAQSVIEANPCAYVILTTHCYMKHQGTLVLDGDQYGLTAMGLPSSDYNGNEIHAALIEPNKNVRMMLCGHFIGGALHAHASDISRTTGTVAHQLFVNYQDEPPAEQHMMILRFRPDAGVIDVSLYNAHTNSEDPLYPTYSLPYEPMEIEGSVAIPGDAFVDGEARINGGMVVGGTALPSRLKADSIGNLYVGSDNPNGMSGGGNLRVRGSVFAESITPNSLVYVNGSNEVRPVTLSGLSLSNGELSVASESNASNTQRDTFHFNGASGSRIQWALAEFGDGIGVSGGMLTVLARVQFPDYAATRNIWSVSQSQDASSYGGNGFMFYLHSSDRLRVELGDATTANRKYAATSNSVMSRFGGEIVATAITHDGSSGAPTIFLNGLPESTTTSGTGTQPAWGAGFNDNFLTVGTMHGGSRWIGFVDAPIILNTVLSSDQIYEWSRTGRLPDWARIASGSMAAKTSGSLVTGRRYRITGYVSGDSFTNVGASSDSTGVEFTATGPTPSVWTNASQIVLVGPLFSPVVQPVPVVADSSDNSIYGAVFGGVTPITTRRDWVIQGRTSTNGNQALVSSSLSLFASTAAHRLNSMVVINLGASSTVQVGSSSGASDYATSFTASGGPNEVSLVSRFNFSGGVWVNSNNTSVLEFTITGTKID